MHILILYLLLIDFSLANYANLPFVNYFPESDDVKVVHPYQNPDETTQKNIESTESYLTSTLTSEINTLPGEIPKEIKSESETSGYRNDSKPEITQADPDSEIPSKREVSSFLGSQSQICPGVACSPPPNPSQANCQISSEGQSTFNIMSPVLGDLSTCCAIWICERPDGTMFTHYGLSKSSEVKKGETDVQAQVGALGNFGSYSALTSKTPTPGFPTSFRFSDLNVNRPGVINQGVAQEKMEDFKPVDKTQTPESEALNLYKFGEEMNPNSEYEIQPTYKRSPYYPPPPFLPQDPQSQFVPIPVQYIFTLPPPGISPNQMPVPSPNPYWTFIQYPMSSYQNQMPIPHKMPPILLPPPPPPPPQSMIFNPYQPIPNYNNPINRINPQFHAPLIPGPIPNGQAPYYSGFPPPPPPPPQFVQPPSF